MKKKIILFFLDLFLVLLLCIIYCSKNRISAEKNEIINVQLLMFFI
jgi:hypothetical protein